MKQHNPKFLEIVQDAKSRVSEISVDELKLVLEKNDNWSVIDVRERDERINTGFIATAQHISKGVLERDIEGRINDPAAPIVVYCSGGFRSLLAADNLQKMGYSQVKSLTGGFSAWQAAGYPVER